jgi:hypothetical protein
VPLQAIAHEAIERQLSSRHSRLRFPGERGGYLDLHNFRNREWKPAQSRPGSSRCAEIRSLTYVRDPRTPRWHLHHDLSRNMGSSLTMIDRHYGHLARREHPIRPLDELSAGQRPRWTPVDAAWTLKAAVDASQDNESIA